MPTTAAAALACIAQLRADRWDLIEPGPAELARLQREGVQIVIRPSEQPRRP